MGLAQYFSQMTLNAVMQAFKMSFKEWLAWMRQYYLWSSATFFVAAAAAGLVVKLVGHLNLYSVLIIAPIIIIVYLTYRTYLKSLDALQESEARFRSSFDYGTIGMALVSPEGFWIEVNQSLRQLLNRSEADLLKLQYSDSIHPDDYARIKPQVEALIRGAIPTFQIEVRLIQSDGNLVWAVLSASVAHNAHKSVRHIILQTQDVTLRKKAEEQLLHDASHDMLTGLLNRAAYTNHLHNALERSKRHNQRVLAVLFLDLDGFKLINDSLGHSIGDEMLKVTAARLLECVRTVDTVARLGGDEFTILLEDLEDIAQAVSVAERIRQKLSEPFELAGQEIFIGTSIGVATSEITYREPGEMLRDADAAMYQAKARGKGCFVLFDHEMYASATRQLRLANDLRRATARNEFVLHYQAMQSLESGEITGFEALLRWNHPHYGLLMPSEFICIAEENGLTGEIDGWAMREGCRQLKEWQAQTPEHANLLMSVNVSTKQFAQTGLFEFVTNVLKETNLNPRCLQLEITESAMVKSMAITARILADLSHAGVSIALDDFGTGYSSLSYLHELPISTLKIDRSFISRITDETDGAAIVRAIIVLARNLRIKVIAEGIESLDQLKNLRGMGCDFGQGYLFSRPIPAAEAYKLLCVAQQHQAQLHATRERTNKLRLVSGI